jgi:hypothetical protein
MQAAARSYKKQENGVSLKACEGMIPEDTYLEFSLVKLSLVFITTELKCNKFMVL